MKTFIFLLSISFNFLWLSGQSTLPGGFLKGYILTKTDTIHCYVLNKNFFASGEVVKYKFSKDDQVQEMDIDKIIEVRDNALLYKKITFNKRSFLAIQQIKGPVSLFEVNSAYQIAGYHYSAQYNKKGVYYLAKADKVVRIDRDAFREEVKSVLTDDPETAKKIDEQLKNYGDIFTYIKALVNNYNSNMKK